MYKQEEKLELTHRIAVTKEVYDLLRKEKKRLVKEKKKMSMAKIVCNLILKEYGQRKNI